MSKLSPFVRKYLILGAVMLFVEFFATGDNANGASYLSLFMALFLLEPWIFFGPWFSKWGLTDFQLFVLFYSINASVLLALSFLFRRKSD
jgi:hypothetical protein